MCEQLPPNPGLDVFPINLESTGFLGLVHAAGFGASVMESIWVPAVTAERIATPRMKTTFSISALPRRTSGTSGHLARSDAEGRFCYRDAHCPSGIAGLQHRTRAPDIKSDTAEPVTLEGLHMTRLTSQLLFGISVTMRACSVARCLEGLTSGRRSSPTTRPLLFRRVSRVATHRPASA